MGIKLFTNVLLFCALSAPAFATGYSNLKPLPKNRIDVQSPSLSNTNPLTPLADQAVEAPRAIGHAPIPSNISESIAFLMRGQMDKRYQTSKKTWNAIREFYANRQNQPLWMSEKGYNAKGLSLGKRILKAHADGLNIAHYPLVELPKSEATLTQLAAAELHLTISAYEYISDLSTGSINPKSISGYIDFAPKKPKVSSLVEGLAKSNNPSLFVNRYEPQHPQYRQLKSLLLKSYAKKEEREKNPVLPIGVSLKFGIQHPAVSILRTRLEIEQGDNPNLFDDAVKEAVEQFQTANRLGPDGVVGPRTRKMLNGAYDAEASPEVIMVNMERLRWLPRNVSDFRVEVNIPEYRVRVFDGAKKTYDGRVVVGKLRHQTPQFADHFEYVEVNPYWNVPQSIATQEMLPKLLSNPAYLDSRGFELFDRSSGRKVSSTAVNWSQYAGRSALPFAVRQPPGRKNALGNVKFMFPNKHAVYLHDTPSRNLFANERRAYSHGCVRVHNPFEFANALLQNEDFSGHTLEKKVGGRNEAIRLKKKIPISLGYFTVRVDENGKLRRFGDVYGYDKRMINMMGLIRS